jgi:hypothetical protein
MCCSCAAQALAFVYDKELVANIFDAVPGESSRGRKLSRGGLFVEPAQANTHGSGGDSAVQWRVQQEQQQQCVAGLLLFRGGCHTLSAAAAPAARRPTAAKKQPD